MPQACHLLAAAILFGPLSIPRTLVAATECPFRDSMASLPARGRLMPCREPCPGCSWSAAVLLTHRTGRSRGCAQRHFIQQARFQAVMAVNTPDSSSRSTPKLLGDISISHASNLRSAAQRFSFALVAGQKLNRFLRYTGEAGTDFGLLFAAVIPEKCILQRGIQTLEEV